MILQSIQRAEHGTRGAAADAPWFASEHRRAPTAGLLADHRLSHHHRDGRDRLGGDAQHAGRFAGVGARSRGGDGALRGRGGRERRRVVALSLPGSQHREVHRHRASVRRMEPLSRSHRRRAQNDAVREPGGWPCHVAAGGLPIAAAVRLHTGGARPSRARPSPTTARGRPATSGASTTTRSTRSIASSR